MFADKVWDILYNSSMIIISSPPPHTHTHPPTPPHTHTHTQAKLEQLNLIVWPEIWSQVERRIEQAVAEGYAVCVIDAAVMLSAGWEKNMHEIWVAIAPKKDVR